MTSATLLGIRVQRKHRLGEVQKRTQVLRQLDLGKWQRDAGLEQVVRYPRGRRQENCEFEVSPGHISQVSMG